VVSSWLGTVLCGEGGQHGREAGRDADMCDTRAGYYGDVWSNVVCITATCVGSAVCRSSEQAWSSSSTSHPGPEQGDTRAPDDYRNANAPGV